MNHRQWKKNFKKKHGRNPTIWEDKRKRVKYSAALICSIDWTKFMDSVCKACNAVVEAIADMANTAVETFTQVFTSIIKEEQ